jgi:hypothetical protein
VLTTALLVSAFLPCEQTTTSASTAVSLVNRRPVEISPDVETGNISIDIAETADGVPQIDLVVDTVVSYDVGLRHCLRGPGMNGPERPDLRQDDLVEALVPDPAGGPSGRRAALGLLWPFRPPPIPPLMFEFKSLTVSPRFVFSEDVLHTRKLTDA